MKSPSKLAQKIIENDTDAWVRIHRKGEYPREVYSEKLDQTFVVHKTVEYNIKEKRESWWVKLRRMFKNEDS